MQIRFFFLNLLLYNPAGPMPGPYSPVVCQMRIVLDVMLACCSVLLSLSIESRLSLRLAPAVCVKRTKARDRGEEGSVILLNMTKTHTHNRNQTQPKTQNLI